MSNLKFRPYEEIVSLRLNGVYYHQTKDCKSIIYLPGKNVFKLNMKLMTLEIKANESSLLVVRAYQNKGTYNSTNGRVLSHLKIKRKNQNLKKQFGF